jgi:hypothetical protein
MLRQIDKLEHRSRPVLQPGAFLSRLARACLAWVALTGFGLALGMAGYMATEGMGAVDAFVNAAMILSGMGPVGELRTTAGKLFAGSYAILSGLLIVIATGFVLAPVLHRVMHVLHVDKGGRGGD